MKVKVFSINKFKSNLIRSGFIDTAKHPPRWAIDASNCEVRNNGIIGVSGKRYAAYDQWHSMVDEKYVRRRYNDLY